MAATKVAITIDSKLLAELDQLVAQQVFPNRSKAIQEALEANQALDAEIEKIRPEVASLPLPPQ